MIHARQDWVTGTLEFTGPVMDLFIVCILPFQLVNYEAHIKVYAFQISEHQHGE